jgi:hypothetical protein
MSWPEWVEDAHQAVLAVFGVTVTWQPQGSPGVSIAIEALEEKLPIEEPVPPGSLTGTTNARLWIDTDSLSPAPAEGDEIIFNGVSYDVGNVEADIEGGAVLVLKRNA